MDVPISLGIMLATAMSLYQTMRGSEQVYFDAAVTLLFFLLIGRYLDQRMRVRAAGAAANLLGLQGDRPRRHRRRTAPSRASRPRSSCAGHARARSAAGERIAVDGRDRQGTARSTKA